MIGRVPCQNDALVVLFHDSTAALRPPLHEAVVLLPHYIVVSVYVILRRPCGRRCLNQLIKKCQPLIAAGKKGSSSMKIEKQCYYTAKEEKSQ